MPEFGTLERNRITKDDVKTVASNFCSISSVETVTEIVDGVNASAKLVDDKNNEYFIKFSTFHREDNVFQTQPLVLSQLQSEQRTYFDTPTPIGYDYTRNNSRYHFYVTEWIPDGKKVDIQTIEDETTDVTASIAETVGSILGEVNSIEVDSYGEPETLVHNEQSCHITNTPQFQDDSWSEFYLHYLTQVLYSVAPRFYDLAETIQHTIDKRSVRDATPSLLHLDYWWENLVWTDDHPYLIDWERAVGGDPLLNKYLSQHYLFDTVEMPEKPYMERKDEYITLFNNAYETAYNGTQSLSADTETELLYRLLPLTRELRAFPYWWRHKSDDWQDYRATQVEQTITDILTEL